MVVLILNKAKVNSKDTDGFTALHEGESKSLEILKRRLLTYLNQAAQYGHKKIAEILLSNGGEVNIKSNGGVTPLHYGNWG